MGIVYALAGNPNCGKTTLFNELTGSNQYVGNWPGVTVEKKEGRLKSHGENVSAVDLPGIYSLSPYSTEEMVSRNYILDGKPDLIINVVDATNLERNLYLSLQLAELGRPMIIALNMMDMLRSRGIEIDVQRLEHLLGMPVVPVSASRGKGLHELVERAHHNSGQTLFPFDERHLADRAQKRYGKNPYILHELHGRREHHQTEYNSSYIVDDIYSEHVMEAILRIEDIIAPRCLKDGMALRWTAVKILDDDTPVIESLNLTDGEAHLIEEIISAIEHKHDERDIMIADEKYKFICDICSRCVTRTKSTGEMTISDHIDRIATHKLLALPLFFGVMALIFAITFGPIGTWMTDIIDDFIVNVLIPETTNGLIALNASDWSVSLICDGIITGLGAIVSFFPQILLLFFFLSLLEDSGYMARAAFIMDKLLHKTGLSGKSFVPMLMGFGCSVPGIMAARTLENERDRRMTIILTPFMSCSAKMPVYALIITAFFPRHQALVITGIYITGVFVAVIVAIILRKTVLKGGHAPFVMELPPYRLPTAKTMGVHMYERIKDFVVRAGTILLGATVVIWFLQSFSFSFPLQMLSPEQSGDSILAVIGKTIAPLFIPLGFGSWQTSVALVTGFIAKETVVSTLSILYGTSSEGVLNILQNIFTPASALAFLVFVLLYMPCIAAFVATRREMNSTKWAVGAAALQTGVAWLVAMMVYQFGTLAVNLFGLITG